jgi:sugar phosphate isomerase/epimerase
VTDFHPRLFVNPCCLPSRTTLHDYFQALRDLGISRTGMARPRMLDEGWEASLDLLERTGVDVGYLSYNRAFALAEPETWADATTGLLAAIDAHQRFGSRIYCLTGPGPAIGLTWEEATDAFVRAVAPAAAHARAAGVSLMLEPTNSAFSDLHCLHSLRETLEIVEAADMDICVEVDPCWMERDLRNTILSAGPRIGLVQLSDRKLGSRCMDRAVPGDGVVPLEPIIEWILETGYAGPIDLELWGNTGRDEVEGLLRGLDHVGKILERLGA